MEQIEINAAAVHKLCTQETPSITLPFRSRSWIGRIFGTVLTMKVGHWIWNCHTIVGCLKMLIWTFLTFDNVWRIPFRDNTLQKAFLTKHLKLLISVKEVPLETSWLSHGPWIIWVFHFLGNQDFPETWIPMNVMFIYVICWLTWFSFFSEWNLVKPQVGRWLYLSQFRPFLVTNLNPERQKIK